LVALSPSVLPQEAHKPWVARLTRGRLEIIRDVLDVCSQGATVSGIMDGCNMSFAQIKTYVPLLIRKGFLTVRREDRKDVGGAMREMTVYRTTNYGVVLLLALQNVQKILEPEKVATATTP